MSIVPALPAQGTDWYALGQHYHDAAVARSLPEHAGRRPGPFDPARSVYNLKASNTRRVRAAIAAARAGAGLCRLTFVGDSLTAGAGGGSVRGTSDAVTFLAGELRRAGHVVGELVHSTISGGSLADPRISFESGSYSLPYGTIVQGTPGTVAGTGTVFEIVTTRLSGPFTVSVDGGATTTRTPAGGAQGVQVHTVTGLSNAAHTATVSPTTAAPVYVYAAGFRPVTGIVLENAGISGSRSVDWASTAALSVASSLFDPANVDHDLVVIELGANDRWQDVPTATFQQNLGDLIDRARARDASVAVTFSNEPSDIGSTDTPWPEIGAAVYDAADSRDVPLLDLTDRFGPHAGYNVTDPGRDFTLDSIHLTPTGNAAKARAWLDLLAVV